MISACNWASDIPVQQHYVAHRLVADFNEQARELVAAAERATEQARSTTQDLATTGATLTNPPSCLLARLPAIRVPC